MLLQKIRHLFVRHGIGEFGVDLIELTQQSHDRLDTFFDDLADGLCGVELRFLFEKADREPRRHGRLALEVLIDAGQNPQQRALSGSVQTDNADLRSIKIREIDVL